MWNRNDLTLFSSFTSAEGGGFYEQHRSSAQHAVVGDALLYFRALGSGVRPYLSAGVGLVRFGSEPAGGAVGSGLAPPEGEIASTRLVLRVAVGLISRWESSGAFVTASARASAATRSARA